MGYFSTHDANSSIICSLLKIFSGADFQNLYPFFWPSSKSSEHAVSSAIATSLSRPAWYPALSTASRMNLIASSLSRLGANPPSSPDVGVVAGFLQHALEMMKDLGDHANGFAKRLRPDRHDHEFLEIDLVVRVLAAVDDVGHRNGQHPGIGTAQVAVERQTVGGRGRLGGRQANSQNRVGAELPLVGRSVGLDQRPVQPHLVGRIATHRRLGKHAVHVGHRLGHAFSEVSRLVPVAKLDCLVNSGACPRRNGRPAQCAVSQHHIHLDGRIAAAVEDLAPAHLLRSEPPCCVMVLIALQEVEYGAARVRHS